MVQVLVMKQVTLVHQILLHNYTSVCAYKLLFQLFVYDLSNCFLER